MSKPPITTVAKGRCTSAPSPELTAIGRKPNEATKAVIKTNEMIASNQYEMNLQNFENAYRSAFAQYQKFEETVQYFETTALKNAETITTTANQQFLNGDINYLEWVLLLNQATTIQSDYIEAVKNRNNAVAELNFYSNK